jgi:hypothetical protein
VVPEARLFFREITKGLNVTILSGCVDAAIDHARRGWPVVILHGLTTDGCTCQKRDNCNSPGKHPRQRAWHENATTDEAEIRRLWKKWPNSNVGILLGPQSQIVDVEFDDAEGEKTAERLLKGTKTPTFKSGRGVHRLFRFREGLNSRTAVVHVQGLEVRLGVNGKGTSSILPTSVHASGTEYEWLPDLSPDETIKNFRQVETLLIGHFGVDRDMRSITEGDADAWRQELANRYASATLNKHIKRARQLFKAARRSKVVDVNPFTDVVGGNEVNDDRKHFIEHQTIESVIEMCPDVQWRSILALARYGGLRCPSEVLGLKWGHIDWEKGRFKVTSPKTKSQGPVLHRPTACRQQRSLPGVNAQ